MRTRYDLLNHLLTQLFPECPFQETGWRALAEAAVGQRLVQAEKEKQVDIGEGECSADSFPGTGLGQAEREEA